MQDQDSKITFEGIPLYPSLVDEIAPPDEVVDFGRETSPHRHGRKIYTGVKPYARHGFRKGKVMSYSNSDVFEYCLKKLDDGVVEKFRTMGHRGQGKILAMWNMYKALPSGEMVITKLDKKLAGDPRRRIRMFEQAGVARFVDPSKAIWLTRDDMNVVRLLIENHEKMIGFENPNRTRAKDPAAPKRRKSTRFPGLPATLEPVTHVESPPLTIDPAELVEPIHQAVMPPVQPEEVAALVSVEEEVLVAPEENLATGPKDYIPEILGNKHLFDLVKVWISARDSFNLAPDDFPKFLKFYMDTIK